MVLLLQILPKILMRNTCNTVLLFAESALFFIEFQPGQLVPGVIKHHQNFGIFVELPGGLTGLAPLKVSFW